MLQYIALNVHNCVYSSFYQMGPSVWHHFTIYLDKQLPGETYLDILLHWNDTYYYTSSRHSRTLAAKLLDKSWSDRISWPVSRFRKLRYVKLWETFCGISLHLSDTNCCMFFHHSRILVSRLQGTSLSSMVVVVVVVVARILHGSLRRNIWHRRNLGRTEPLCTYRRSNGQVHQSKGDSLI